MKKSVILSGIGLFVIGLMAWSAFSLYGKRGGEQFTPMVGQWLRPDGGYQLHIKAIGKDGIVEASYFNPNPIHVSRARAQEKNGNLFLAVELKDKGYPGNFYELVYLPDKDILTGRYNHLGLKQAFDVNFIRKTQSHGN